MHILLVVELDLEARQGKKNNLSNTHLFFLKKKDGLRYEGYNYPCCIDWHQQKEA